MPCGVRMLRKQAGQPVAAAARFSSHVHTGAAAEGFAFPADKPLGCGEVEGGLHSHDYLL